MADLKFIGRILGAIGGILGLMWRPLPSEAAPVVVRPTAGREEEDIGIPDATETHKIRSGRRYD